MHQTKTTKQKYKPSELSCSNTTDILCRTDSNIYFYRADKELIKHIALNSENNYTLFVSLYAFCAYSLECFDSVYNYARTNNLPLFVIDNTDWLYRDRVAYFFKNKCFDKNILALDINKYGSQFHCRKKWRSFIKDICNTDTKSFGYNDIILMDKNANIILYGDFFEKKQELNEILNKI